MRQVGDVCMHLTLDDTCASERTSVWFSIWQIQMNYNIRWPIAINVWCVCVRVRVRARSNHFIISVDNLFNGCMMRLNHYGNSELSLWII